MTPTTTPARPSALGTPGAGPGPLARGATPAAAEATTRAIGRRPRRPAKTSLASTSTAAPSFRPELLPAVTVPSLRKAGFSRPSDSIVVSRRGRSSTATGTGSPLRCGTGAAMALRRELVLLTARDGARHLVDVLGRLAHRLGAKGLLHPRVGKAPAE